MSEKIVLTEHEKMRLKKALPYLKDEEWNKAFDMIGNGDYSEEYNSPLHILTFLKTNGIDLLHKITKIDSFAFYNCNELKEIEIPDNVIVICYNAFEGCKELISVKLESSIRGMGSQVFNKCKALTKLKYNGTQKQWNNVDRTKGFYAFSSLETIECTDGDISLV